MEMHGEGRKADGEATTSRGDETAPGPVGGTAAGEHEATVITWIVIGVLSVAAVALYFAIGAKRERVRAKREEERSAPKPPVPVVVLRAEPRTLTDTIKLPAMLAAWDEVWVKAQVGGIVRRLDVEEGQEVEEDAPLCRIDDADYKAAVAQARARVEQTKAAYDLAKLSLNRVVRLRDDGAAGEAEFDAASAGERMARAAVSQAMAAQTLAELAYERTVVRSPMAGTVARLPVTVGTLLSRGKEIARIVDIQKLKAEVSVPERDILAAGKVVETDVSVDALADMKFTGRRVRLGVEPEEGALVYKLELAIENPRRDGTRLLRPGMFATVKITRAVYPDAIAVPLLSLVAVGSKTFVFVAVDDLARRRPVTLGPRVGGRMIVTDGLERGEMVIVRGQQMVEDGDPVAVKHPTAEQLKQLKRLE